MLRPKPDLRYTTIFVFFCILLTKFRFYCILLINCVPSRTRFEVHNDIELWDNNLIEMRMQQIKDAITTFSPVWYETRMKHIWNKVWNTSTEQILSELLVPRWICLLYVINEFIFPESRFEVHNDPFVLLYFINKIMFILHFINKLCCVRNLIWGTQRYLCSSVFY